MAITKAIKGAIVPVQEINSTFGTGDATGLNDLVNRGVISPREGGQKFEFLQDHDFSSAPGDTGQPSSPVTSTDDTRRQLTEDLNASVEEIDAFRQQLQEREDRTISEIERGAAQEKQETEQKQKSQTGARTLFLAGTGALGRTVSAQQNLLQLEQSHNKELRAIEDRKQRLINEAKNAYADKDFNALQAKIGELRAARQEAADLELKLENQRIKLAQEARAQAEFEFKLEDREIQKQKDTAAGLASGFVTDSLETPSGEDLANIANDFGIDPTFLMMAVNERLDAVRKIRVTEFKDYFNIAKQLDEGIEVEAPDGTVIRGLKQTKPDIITYEAKVGGMKYKVGADRTTGEVLWQNEVGFSSGTGTGKTVTWSMAKELGDISLYGQPVAEIYQRPEALTYEEWVINRNAEDPENYPLLESSESLVIEYFDYLDSLKSPAERFEDDGGENEPDEQYAAEIIRANSQLVADGTFTEEDLVLYVMEQANLTRSKATSAVNQFLE